MSTYPVYVSARPDALGSVGGIADGIEVKLDWEHVGGLLEERTLSDLCEAERVDPESVVSIHLPPGTNRRHGMAIAPGNTGTISSFVHEGIGDAVTPDWFTVHTVRRFEYEDQLSRLATITKLTNTPLALENTPDRSHLHSPEDLAAVALLVASVDRLEDVYLLVDTAHIDSDRLDRSLDERALRAVLERVPETRAGQLEDELRRFVSAGFDDVEAAVPRSDPWRPVLTTLAATGGDWVRAVHLNDPVDDGLPRVGHEATEGLGAVLEYCRLHDIAIVLEPGSASVPEIESVVACLRNRS